MKTLTYFPDYCSLNSKPVIEAFLESASKHYKIVENDINADIAVIWSCLWAGRMKGNKEVYNHFKIHNKPCLILEVGALQRNVTWKVALNHITNDGIYGNKDNLDWDRPKKLGLPELHPPRRHYQKESILVCLQHDKSEQVSSIHGMEYWLYDTIKNIEAKTDRPIIVRPHPRSVFNRQKFLDYEFETPNKIENTYDDFDMKFNYWAMINYNSAGPAVQSLIHGCPIIVDDTSLAYPCSNKYSNLDKPVIDLYTRDKWYVEMAHTEYTVDEIRDGRWYERLKWAIE